MLFKQGMVVAPDDVLAASLAAVNGMTPMTGDGLK